MKPPAANPSQPAPAAVRASLDGPEPLPIADGQHPGNCPSGSDESVAANGIPVGVHPARQRVQLPRPGFTLVELLVAVAIVIVLAALAFVVTRKLRASAAKVADLNNLRNLATCAMVAGSDNVGRLPSLHSSSYAPYWLSDRETLESYGIHKENCYAPTRGIYGGAPDYKWWYMDPGGTPVHYVYFANDGTTRDNGWFSGGRVMPPKEHEYRGSMAYRDIIRDPSKAFARNIGDDAWYSVLWAGLCRDYSGSPRVAALMGDDGEPLGINVIYIDGHSEWVPGGELLPRYTAGGLKLFW